jgi:hypothetical protein
MSESPEGLVGLAEAIEALRGELLRAWGGDQVRPLRFKPAPVELTVQVAVTNAGKGRVGIKWWLLDANAEVSRQNVITQTLKLTLDPIAFEPDGQKKEFLISDAEDDGLQEVREAAFGDPE